MFCHFLGVAEDADECFSEATALCLQQEHTSTSSLEKLVFANENGVLPSSATASLDDFSTWLLSRNTHHPHANKISEVPGYCQGRETALHGFRADSLISL
jgi:anaphase-promoting complex subunit 3